MAVIFSTSDSSNQDVLLLSKVRNLEVSGADLALIGSERSHDWEQIGRGLGADWEWIPSHSCDLSESIRGSESQSGSPPNPLWFRSLEDRSQKSCDLFEPIRSIRCAISP